MERKQLLSPEALAVTLNRLSRQIWEQFEAADDFCLIGLQPRGVLPARRLHTLLEGLYGRPVRFGALDITFFRDDFRRRDEPLRANQTDIPFLVEGLNVVLVDDVLFTGRSVRSAMDALAAFGRPGRVELLTLVDRRLTRELPVEATYSGLQVDSVHSQRVVVEWQEMGHPQDGVWLTS